MFLLVGGLNTLFGYGIFAVFIYFNFHYSLAAALSTVLGILFNFKTTGSLVFKSKDNKLLIKFVGVYLIAYIINVLFLGILNIYMSNYLAGAIIILPLSFFSFILMKKFVFTDSSEPQKTQP